MKLAEVRALAEKFAAAADAAETAGKTEDDEVEIADIGLARVDASTRERREAISVAEVKAAGAEDKPAD